MDSWRQTSPPGGFYSVSLAAKLRQARAATVRDSAILRRVLLSGHAFIDSNGDGAQEANEPDYPGALVGANAANYPNGENARAITDAKGNWIIDTLDPGNYTVFLQPNFGDQTTIQAYNDEFNATFKPGAVKSDFVFNARLGTDNISGFVINDANADSFWDVSEEGLPAAQVYLDLNNDGQWQPGEPITPTYYNGGFYFPNLAPGTYQVRQFVQDGYRQTFPQNNAAFTTFVTTGVNSQVLLANAPLSTPDTTLPPPVAPRFITDNSDPGVTTTGDWWPDTPAQSFYGHDFLNDGAVSNVESAVTFPLGGSVQRSYAVFARWPVNTDRPAATHVPFDIITPNGTVTVYEDESQNQGQWVLLGNFVLNPATAAVVVRNSVAVGLVSADAVGIALTSAPPDLQLPPPPAPPAAPAGFTATPVSSREIDLSWTDNSADESGFVLESSTDGTTWRCARHNRSERYRLFRDKSLAGDELFIPHPRDQRRRFFADHLRRTGCHARIGFEHFRTRSTRPEPQPSGRSRGSRWGWRRAASNL